MSIDNDGKNADHGVEGSTPTPATDSGNDRLASLDAKVQGMIDTVQAADPNDEKGASESVQRLKGLSESLAELREAARKFAAAAEEAAAREEARAAAENGKEPETG